MNIGQDTSADIIIRINSSSHSSVIDNTDVLFDRKLDLIPRDENHISTKKMIDSFQIIK
jgi:hypothetical protein